MAVIALCLLILLTLDIINYETQAARVRRLVGGTDAAESEFPYQASLRYFDLHICSGTLISDRHVLSAAHCVCGLIDYPSEELSVRTGSVKLTEGKKHVVESITCHPDYIYGPEESWVADVVVITLAEQICVSATQSPIALATRKIPVGDRAVVSGWGRVHPFSFLSRNLQKLSLPIIDSGVCQGYYKNVTILDSQICTFEKKGVGACKGDSGSPLVYNDTLVGIFSWTRPCAIGFPDVFTNVLYFTAFIEQVVRGDISTLENTIH